MKSLLLSTLVTLVPVAGTFAQSVDLHERYKPGFSYKQEVSIVQESSVSTGRTKNTTKSETSIALESTVTPADSGVSVAVRYGRVAMSLDQDGKSYRFDSAEPGTPNVLAPLRWLGGVVGRGYTVKLNDKGNVTAVQDIEQIAASFGSFNPTVGVPYRELFGKDAMKTIIEQSMLRPPAGRAPKPGESWPLAREITVPGLGKLTMTGSYKFVGMSEFEGHQCAEIAVDASMTNEPPPQAVLDLQDNDQFDTLSWQMRLKLEESSVKGIIHFDPAISFPRNTTITQSLSVKAKIPDGTSDKIDMPFKQTITVKLVEASDVHPK